MINLPLPIRKPPERIQRTCALGLRFLDKATGLLVGADVAIGQSGRECLGLWAHAWPINAPERKVAGIVTPSGVVAFHGLAGLREFENSGESNPWASTEPRRFQVEVSDRMGRFLPCTFVINAPERGTAVFAGEGSAPWIEERGAVPLFSVPSRLAPAGLAVVRAELREVARDRPAAWALVEATYFSGGVRRTAHGLADDQGRLLMMFPYPEGHRRVFNGSPPGDSRGIWQQKWTIDLSVFHDSVNNPEPVADYARRLNQLRMAAWKGRQSLPALLGPQELQFGRDLDLGIVDLAPE
jgi:hypothetical protein